MSKPKPKPTRARPAHPRPPQGGARGKAKTPRTALRPISSEEQAEIERIVGRLSAQVGASLDGPGTPPVRLDRQLALLEKGSRQLRRALTSPTYPPEAAAETSLRLLEATKDFAVLVAVLGQGLGAAARTWARSATQPQRKRTKGRG